MFGGMIRAYLEVINATKGLGISFVFYLLEVFFIIDIE